MCDSGEGDLDEVLVSSPGMGMLPAASSDTTGNSGTGWPLTAWTAVEQRDLGLDPLGTCTSQHIPSYRVATILKLF